MIFSKMNHHIWYCSYGSNLYFERFKLYILGGTAPFIRKNFSGCTQKHLPKGDAGFAIPYELYFSKASTAWENKGVGFISHQKDTSKATLCRMYKITKSQFEQIVLQENALNPDDDLPIDYEKLFQEGSLLLDPLVRQNKWYPRLMCVGTKEDLPIVTFTSILDMDKAVYSPPGKKYLTTILKGIRQSHRHLEPTDLLAYLKPLKGIKDHYSDSQLEKIIHDAL